MAEDLVDTYKARYRLDMGGGKWREYGELVPEAHDWERVESWLHTGRLEETKVSEAEFTAAVDKFAPDCKERLLERAGLPRDEVVLEGPHKTPRRRRPKAADATLEPLKADPGADPEVGSDSPEATPDAEAPAPDAAPTPAEAAPEPKKPTGKVTRVPKE